MTILVYIMTYFSQKGLYFFVGSSHCEIAYVVAAFFTIKNNIPDYGNQTIFHDLSKIASPYWYDVLNKDDENVELFYGFVAFLLPKCASTVKSMWYGKTHDCTCTCICIHSWMT